MYTYKSWFNFQVQAAFLSFQRRNAFPTVKWQIIKFSKVLIRGTSHKIINLKCMYSDGFNSFSFVTRRLRTQDYTLNKALFDVPDNCTLVCCLKWFIFVVHTKKERNARANAYSTRWVLIIMHDLGDIYKRLPATGTAINRNRGPSRRKPYY